MTDIFIFSETFIKSCDYVGLRSSYKTEGKTWWLSNAWQYAVYKASCPGKTFSMMEDLSRCDAERWRIEALGKRCGDRIEHKDRVTFKGVRDNEYIYYFYELLGRYVTHGNKKEYWEIYAEDGEVFKFDG